MLAAGWLLGCGGRDLWVFTKVYKTLDKRNIAHCKLCLRLRKPPALILLSGSSRVKKMIAKALPQLPRARQLRELFPEETVPAQVGRPLRRTWVILKAL